MYCSECGAQGVGKFCSACGVRLSAAGELAGQVIELPLDWVTLVDYDSLIRIPAVRDRIACSAAQSQRRMTGEDFLDLCGKALGNFAGAPLPMSSIAHFAQSLHAKLGVKTGKSRSQFFPTPPGAVLVALLCSLAREGRHLRGVHQLTDGCIVVAALPSDLFALEGDLMISVGLSGAGSQVDAKTEIKGQLFDWGKSRRCLEALFAELGSAAAA